MEKERDGKRKQNETGTEQEQDGKKWDGKKQDGLNALAKAEGRKYDKKCSLHKEPAGLKGRRFAGIVGPRGCGKTIIFKQSASEYSDAFNARGRL